MNLRRRVLETGGSGFSGMVIFRAARKAGYGVVNFDRQLLVLSKGTK